MKLYSRLINSKSEICSNGTLSFKLESLAKKLNGHGKVNLDSMSL